MRAALKEKRLRDKDLRALMRRGDLTDKKLTAVLKAVRERQAIVGECNRLRRVTAAMERDIRDARDICDKQLGALMERVGEIEDDLADLKIKAAALMEGK